MLQEIICRGLVIKPGNSRYIWIHKGESNFYLNDSSKKLIELSWTDSNSQVIADLLNLKHIGKSLILPNMLLPELIKETTVSLNGVLLQKLTWDLHIIKIVIVNDSESKVVLDYDHTTIIVSKDDYLNPEFFNYIFWSGGLKFLKPVQPQRLYSGLKEIRNFPKIIINLRSLELNSESKTIYTLTSNYDNYLIRSVDYLELFFTELRKILTDYGILLVRYNREETVTNTSYLSYRISSTPANYSHPKYADVDDTVLFHRVPIDFEFRCTNMKLFYDFKNKYSNVDLLSNFCEFKTTDRYGDRWSAAVKWGRMSEDFNHNYESDNNANFSYLCSFSCELWFYEAYDISLEFIKEIQSELEIKTESLDDKVLIEAVSSRPDAKNS